MLLFRSEEDVHAWCAKRGRRSGAIFDLTRLWQLAAAWYDDRLDPNWRRRTIVERQVILDGVGLRGAFWRLTDSPPSATASTSS
jgi:Alkylmercury lyase